MGESSYINVLDIMIIEMGKLAFFRRWMCSPLAWGEEFSHLGGVHSRAATLTYRNEPVDAVASWVPTGGHGVDPGHTGLGMKCFFPDKVEKVAHCFFSNLSFL